MINNKTVLILTVSLLASIILAACGAQNADSEPVSASEKPTTVAIEPEPTVAPVETPKEFPTEAPTEAPAEAPAGKVSFANDVFPIIESRCINCHGGDRIEEGLVMLSYDGLMAGSDNGPVIVPGDVEGSLLVELVTSKEMPKRGPKLTPPQIQIITDWVAAGALNN